MRARGEWDDDRLVDALAAGDGDAFAWMLDQYGGALLRLARQYVSTAAVAEEVVQETWLAVIQGIDRFERRSSVKTWLFRILVNIARSRGVREHRTIPFSATASVTDDEPAVDPDRFFPAGHRSAGHWSSAPRPWPEPEQHLLETDALAVVRAAMETLPPAQREVLTLRDVLGWTAPEVSAALEVSDVNQRVLLHRARSKVRAALERHYDDPSPDP